MMDNIRAKSNHIALKIILVLIIIAFVFTGVNGVFFSQPKNYVLTVNGEHIPVQEFQAAINRYKLILRSSYEDENKLDDYLALSQQEGFERQIRGETLRQLINDILIRQYIKKLQITVSDEQVMNTIRQAPQFQKDGQYSSELYQQFLIKYEIKGAQYAENLREQLKLFQVRDAFFDSEFLLPKEIDRELGLIMQNRYVRYAELNIDSLLAKQPYTEEEITATYQTNKELFATPERYKVSYIWMDEDEIGSKINVTSKEIEEYYQQNKNNFMQMARYRLSGIEVKTEEEARQIINQLKAGEDFEKVLKEHTPANQPTSSVGGDLGWYEVTAMTDEMKAANLTEKNQVSSPIKTSTGYQIFRLDDLEAEKVRPLSEVSGEIKILLQEENGLRAYYELQQRVSDAAHEEPYSLNKSAEVSGLKVVSTDWFDANTIPKELNHNEVKDLLFHRSSQTDDSATPASNSDVINIDKKSAIIFRVDEHQEKTYKSLDEVRNKVITIVQRVKAIKEAISLAKAAVNQLQAGKSEKEVLSPLQLKFSEQQTVSRYDINSPLAYLISTIFGMAAPKEAGKSSYTMYDDPSRVILIALDKVEKSELSDEERLAYGKQLYELAKQNTFESLQFSLYQQADIEINEEYLSQ